MERRAFSHQTIFGGLALSLAVGFVIAIYIFDRFVTYEPTALVFVPQDAELAVRLNVEQAVLRSPLERFLLPLLESGRAGPEPRIKHLERKTTLELEVDVREMVYAELPLAVRQAPEGATQSPGQDSADRQDKWLLVLAGHLRKDTVLEGIERMREEEGEPLTRRGDLLVSDDGLALGVAPDGSLLLGSSIAVVEAARLRTSRPGWAKALEAPGVAIGIRANREPAPAGQSESGGMGPGSHVSGATLLVLAESSFPIKASFSLKDDNWTQDQAEALLRSGRSRVGYLVPWDPLRLLRLEGHELRAKGRLGRERFDGVVEAVAQRIRSQLNAEGRKTVRRP